jgi:putative DNA primase/helicase
LKAGRLVRPAKVLEAGAAYRAAMSPVRPFLETCCVLAPSAWTSAADLRREYEAWCSENGERPRDGKTMADALTRAGCASAKRQQQRGWSGIGLRSGGQGEVAF